MTLSISDFILLAALFAALFGGGFLLLALADRAAQEIARRG